MQRIRRGEVIAREKAIIKKQMEPDNEVEEIEIKISETEGIIKRCKIDLIMFKDSPPILYKIKMYENKIIELNKKLEEIQNGNQDTGIEE